MRRYWHTKTGFNLMEKYCCKDCKPGKQSVTISGRAGCWAPADVTFAGTMPLKSCLSWAMLVWSLVSYQENFFTGQSVRLMQQV